MQILQKDSQIQHQLIENCRTKKNNDFEIKARKDRSLYNTLNIKISVILPNLQNKNCLYCEKFIAWWATCAYVDFYHLQPVK